MNGFDIMLSSIVKSLNINPVELAAAIGTVQGLAQTIDARLVAIEASNARIEKALGISPTAPALTIIEGEQIAS